MRDRITRSTTAAAFAAVILFWGMTAGAVPISDRFNHTSTVLPTGDLLLTGGQNRDVATGNTLKSIQLVQERQGGALINLNNMQVERTSHTATLLPNGDIFIFGGTNNAGAVEASYEIFSPKLNCGTTKVNLGAGNGRSGHTATLLKDANMGGKVLICGGFEDTAASVTNQCILYTPGNPLTSVAGSCGVAPTGDAIALANASLQMSTARSGHTASLMTDGRVFITGGIGRPCTVPAPANCSLTNYAVTSEIFNPNAGGGFFASGHALLQARGYHTATVLGDGRILIAGGVNDRDIESNRGFLSSVELYDPTSDAIFPAAPMQERKRGHSAILNLDGAVWIYGGLGNIATSYFNASTNLDAAPIASFVNGALSASGCPECNSLSKTARADMSGAGAVSLPVDTQLGVGVTGMIENGEILFSTPSVAFGGGTAFFVPGTTNPVTGLRADLTDTYVFCKTFSAAASANTASSGDCGRIKQSYLLKNLQGKYIINPLAASPQNQTLTAGQVSITGALNQVSPNQNINPGVAGDFLSGGTTKITFPSAFFGATISSGYFILSNASLVMPSSYTITFTELVGSIPAATPISAAGVATFAATYKWPQGTVVYTGDGSNSFAGPLTPPEAPAANVVLQSMTGVVTFVTDKVTLTGDAFTVDIATIVIEDMMFGDQEIYNPLGNNWFFNWRGVPWTFNHTSVVLPNGDMQTFGGDSCGYPTQPLCNDGTGRRPVPAGTAIFPPNYTFALIPRMPSWNVTATMDAPRANHTTTALTDGNVLTAGGTNGPNVLNSWETFDPRTGDTTQIGLMNAARNLHTATLLVDGRVLVTGGFSTDAVSSGAVATTELFFPGTRTWVVRESMSAARENHAAVLLGDGRVLVTGGYANGFYLNSAEIWDPITQHWTAAGSMSKRRALHQATLLQDGRVLVTGGVNATGILGTAAGDCEIYNPTTNLWTNSASLPTPLHMHRAVMLFDGRIMINGGNDGFGETDSSFIYDPNNDPGGWVDTSAIGNRVQVKRYKHNSTLLPNGIVMVSGGAQATQFNALTSVETFDIGVSSWQIVGSQASGRVGGSLVVPPIVRKGRPNIFAFGGSGASVIAANGLIFNSIDSTFYDGGLDNDTLGSDAGIRVSSISAIDKATFDHGSTVTLSGFHFQGNTEANGGGSGSANSVQYHPRVVLQSLEASGGTASQGSSGFALDMTPFIYQNYNQNPGPQNPWTASDTTIKLVTPSYDPVVGGGFPATSGSFLPYGNYVFRVGSNAQYSSGVIARSGPPTLVGSPAPVNATVASITATSITWTWSAVAGAQGYDLYQSSSGLFISTTNAGQLTFTTSGLSPNTTSALAVAGFNLSGDGALAYSATYFTLAAVPTNVYVGSVTFNSVLVQWSINGNTPGTIYEVSVSTDNPAPGGNGQAPFTTSFSTPVPALLGNVTNHVTINFLTPNTTYSFRVQAYNGSNVASGFSNIVTTMTRTAVVGVAGVAIDPVSILWSWTQPFPPINPAAGDYFKVYDSTTGAVLVTTTNPTFYDIVGSTNTQRSIMVSAVTGAGEGPLSSGATVYTLSAPPVFVNPPVSAASISTGSFTVQWDGSANPPLTLFNLVVTGLGGAVGGSTTTTNQYFGSYGALSPPASLYDIRVNSQNGDGIPTAFVVLGTTSTLAANPTFLTGVSFTPTSILTNWSANNNSSTATYEVTFSTDNFNTDIKTAVSFSAHNPATTALLQNLITGTTYSIRVRAQNIFGVPSGYSNIVTTAPANGGLPLGQLGGFILPGQNNEISGYVAGPPPRFVDLRIPNGSLPPYTFVTLSSQTVAPSPCSNGTGIAVSIVTQPPVQPTGPVFLTIGYTAAEVAGFNLVEVALNRVDVTGQCVPLSTTFDTANNFLTAELNHFTVFQAATVKASSSPDQTVIFPNPFYPSRGQGYVTFVNMPAYSHVRLYTLRGELVHEDTANGSGLLVWGGTNISGRNVASGVYMAVVEAGDAKKIFKVVVLR